MLTGLAMLIGGCATTTSGRGTASPQKGQSQSTSVSSSAQSTTLPDWAPSDTPVTDITVIDGASATAAVGDWVRFTGPSEVNLSVSPESLDLVTYYGPGTSLLMLHPGTVQLDFPNYDKHFDCPDGPCAHPNQPLHMTLTVTDGGSASDIPDPVDLTDLSTGTTVHLVPGQQLRLPAGAEGSAYPGGDSAVWWSAGDHAELVAVEPGTASWGLHPDPRANPDAEVTVTVLVDEP